MVVGLQQRLSFAKKWEWWSNGVIHFREARDEFENLCRDRIMQSFISYEKNLSRLETVHWSIFQSDGLNCCSDWMERGQNRSV